MILFARLQKKVLFLDLENCFVIIFFTFLLLEIHGVTQVYTFYEIIILQYIYRYMQTQSSLTLHFEMKIFKKINCS